MNLDTIFGTAMNSVMANTTVSFVDMMWGRKANCDDFNQSGKKPESAILCLRVVPLKMCIFCFCDCFVRYLEKVVEKCVISTNI